MRRPMRKRLAALLAAVVLVGLVSAQAAPPKNNSRQTGALSPGAVFNRVRSSVFVVEALDRNGAVSKLGSGVVVGGGNRDDKSSRFRWDSEIVTNFHVVEKAWTVRVRKGNAVYPATIAVSDATHDLCVLSVALSALDEPPPLRDVAVSRIAVGDRAYAIGAPEGLELSLSEGLVSGIRKLEDRTYIQTSAAISPGSSGGGLFDSQGRLLGITTFYVEDGQNLNFAIPATYVLDLVRSRRRQEFEKPCPPNAACQADWVPESDLADFGPPPGEPGSTNLEVLTFDPADFNYPFYVAQMLASIGVNWFNPTDQTVTPPVIFFRIGRDGLISDIRIERSSSLPFVDRAARRAVLASSPLPPLPADSHWNSLGVHLRFAIRPSNE
jgi:TonB family protein